MAAADPNIVIETMIETARCRKACASLRKPACRRKGRPLPLIAASRAARDASMRKFRRRPGGAVRGVLVQIITGAAARAQIDDDLLHDGEQCRDLGGGP